MKYKYIFTVSRAGKIPSSSAVGQVSQKINVQPCGHCMDCLCLMIVLGFPGLTLVMASIAITVIIVVIVAAVTAALSTVATADADVVFAVVVTVAADIVVMDRWIGCQRKTLAVASRAKGCLQ